ncbi:unnamed protein product [Camellia sinensis]
MAMSTREHIEEIRKEKFKIGEEPDPKNEDLHHAVNYLSAELYAKDVHFLMELIQLRCGARRSKRHGDLQPSPQPINQVENLALPAQNRTMSGGFRRMWMRSRLSRRRFSTAIRRRIEDEGDWCYSSKWWGNEFDGHIVLRSTSDKGNGIISVVAYPSSRPSEVHWYLQQLVMESLGKEFDLDGNRCARKRSPTCKVCGRVVGIGRVIRSSYLYRTNTAGETCR